MLSGSLQVVVRTYIFVYIRIESSFVSLLKRCLPKHFAEIKLQLPERNEFAENITVTAKVSVRSTCRDDLGPGFGISVPATISHIFCLQA